MLPRAFWFFILGFSFVLADEERVDSKQSILQSYLSKGVKFAKDILSSETITSKVAEFVVKAFQTDRRPTTTKKPYQLHEPYTNDKFDETKYSNENKAYQDKHGHQDPFAAMRQFVKLFGLQPPQISAMAINALLFVAQVISTFFTGPKLPLKPYRSEDMTSWIMNKKSSTLQQLILEAKNESLVQTIDNIIKQQGDDEETSCIRLLVCKISPFVTKMQEVVFGGSRVQDKSSFRNMVQRHLPTEDEIVLKSHRCELEFRNCNLNEV